MKKLVVLCVIACSVSICAAKDWRLTVLIDGAGLPKDAYGQIYKALTTEWPNQSYPLSVPGISTKETVMLKAVLFGIETYTFGVDQIRLMPLSGQGKTVTDTQAAVKDCAADSLIDTIIEKHKPLKEQFREQVETDYIAMGDGVILISLCPNLENFQNGISSEGKKKFQTIKLVRAGDSLLNSATLSKDIKSARGAFDARVTASVLDPANPDRVREQLEEVQKKLVAAQGESVTVKEQMAAIQGQLEKVQSDLADKGAELTRARDVAEKMNRDNEAAVESLKKQLASSMSDALATEEAKRNLQDQLKAAEKKAKEDGAKGVATVEALKKQLETSVSNASETAEEKRKLQEQLKTAEDQGQSEPIVSVVARANDAAQSEGDNENEGSGGGGAVLFVLLILGVGGFLVWKKISKPKLKLVYESAGNTGTVKGTVGNDGRSVLNAKENALSALRIEHVPSEKGREAGFKLKAQAGSKLRYGVGSEAKEIPATGTVPFQFGTRVALYVGQMDRPVGHLEVKRNV